MQARLNSAPRPPRPAHGSAEAVLVGDPRYWPMRFAVLSYLSYCGHDEEGVQATVTAQHDVDVAMVTRLLACLEAYGDVVNIDGEFHVRPGTSLEPPPDAFLPPQL